MIDAITGALHDGFGYVAISYCLAAIGLNIQFGYSGLLNFGQAAFLAIGGYIMGAAIATSGIPTIPAMLIAILFAVALALILGVPTLRLRADYLAIVTIAAAEILRLVFGTSFREYFRGKDGVTGFADGFRGLNPLPEYDGFFLTYSRNELWTIIVGWIVVILICVLVWALMRSPWGRVLRGIREDEDAVRSLGKNVYGYKMQALVLGGVIGCIGGFIGAFGAASVQADTFNLDFTFIALTMLILGGAARVMGPVVGAILFWAVLSFLGSILSDLSANPTVAQFMNADQASNVRLMLVGLVLMLLMIYRPQGIFGDRKEIALDAR
ncbi:branched-chain amino acid ABC transporter permease [Nocardioides aurantiacus]|uniref:Amino acid/amide ABC transporter membrane protein 2 (HAAT family) n=1 Tax=Nocardioides aurantiacus TaxID=86796 RepID=A0A3N2CV62_9ACTN|nr:branched-chain amino acid ABC transporter permease [Nocardioides aurantiacus]ROR91427.1 amino acid/amide ABC transporter membrane protein 2 (HAAT family) [Nocardioides aurantiacus]